MNVIIGPHTVIEAGTIIKERSLIGSNCTIGPMAVIGGSAFETRQKDGRQKILLQAGGVKIGDNVVIQSLSNVDCATFTGFTTIDDETGLDSLIHVAHDCSIGKRVKIAASATISGRVTIDDDSYLGPNCTISNGVKIGKDAKVSIGAVVIQDIGPSQTVSGNFAIDHRKWLRFLSKLKNGKI
jgi:UDP-3-O-[3-hydroxymyristoyl] glucosamine N-acyltransferase